MALVPINEIFKYESNSQAVWFYNETIEGMQLGSSYAVNLGKRYLLFKLFDPKGKLGMAIKIVIPSISEIVNVDDSSTPELQTSNLFFHLLNYTKISDIIIIVFENSKFIFINFMKTSVSYHYQLGDEQYQ